MREGGDRLHFAFESRQRLWVVGLAGTDQLDRARSLEQLMLGQINLAHPAGPEQSLELVLPELAGRIRLGPQRVNQIRPIHARAVADQQLKHHRRPGIVLLDQFFHQRITIRVDDITAEADRDHAGHDDRRAPPIVRNENGVGKQQQEPEPGRVRHKAEQFGVVAHVEVLHVREEDRRDAEDAEFNPAQRLQAETIFAPEHRGKQTHADDVRQMAPVQNVTLGIDLGHIGQISSRAEMSPDEKST